MGVRDAIGGGTPAGPGPRNSGIGGTRRWKWLAVAGIAMILALALAATGRIAHASINACSAASGSTPAVATDCLFAGFEIDGDTPANNGGIDWQSSPQVFGSQAYTPFYDLSKSTSDNMMGRGSKESDQSTWTCVTQKPDPKDDLGATFLAADYSGTTTQFNSSNGKPWAGAIWFETVNGKQYLFGSFQRVSANGDAHVDFEFNRAKQTKACGGDTLPIREKGDVLITFDGNGPLDVAAFTWTCPTVQTAPDPNACTGAGSFNKDANLTAGGTFAGQTNTATQTDPNLAAGVFGEAGLDLTDTIGPFQCGEFGDAFMKDRTATASDIASGSAEVKDYVSPQPFNPGLCPTSSVTKAQADETTQNHTAGVSDESPETGTDDTTLTYNVKCSTSPPTASAGCADTTMTTPMSVNPGDEVVYKVTYHNTGGGATANQAAVVQDTIPTGTTYVASSISCPTGATCIAADSTSYNSSSPCTSTAGTGAITNLVWCLPSEAAGASVPLYFEVDIPGTASSGTVTYGNYATVSDTGTTSSDTGGPSNFVAASATFSANPALSKGEADVSQSSQQCNTATIAASTTASASSNASCILVPAPAYSGTPTFVSSLSSVAPGDILEYQLTYSNLSSTAANTNVVVTDSIPSNSTFVSGTCSASAGTCIRDAATATAASCSDSNVTTGTVATIVWCISSVAVGATDTLTYQVKLASPLNSGTVITNTANGTSDQGSTGPATVTATVVASPNLGLVKTVSAPTACNVGGVAKTCVTYTISYFNTGDGGLSNQTITDTFPSGLTFVSASNSGTNASGTVTWTGITVAAGTTASAPAGSVTLTLAY